MRYIMKGRYKDVLAAVQDPEITEMEACNKPPLTTTMNQAEYKDRFGRACPVCRSNQIEGEFVDVDGMIALQHRWCCECESEWDTVYALLRFENLEEGER